MPAQGDSRYTSLPRNVGDVSGGLERAFLSMLVVGVVNSPRFVPDRVEVDARPGQW